MVSQDNTLTLSPPDKVIDLRLQNYIDFCATSGMVVEDDGTAVQMTVTAFAERLGVTRDTLYKWKYNTSDFWDLVRARRKLLFTGKRESMVWRGLFVEAAKGNTKAAEMVLSHFTDYKPPAQKIDTTIEVKGLADLLQAAQRQGVIDLTEGANGHFIPNDAGASSEDHPALPEKS